MVIFHGKMLVHQRVLRPYSILSYLSCTWNMLWSLHFYTGPCIIYVMALFLQPVVSVVINYPSIAINGTAPLRPFLWLFPQSWSTSTICHKQSLNLVGKDERVRVEDIQYRPSTKKSTEVPPFFLQQSLAPRSPVDGNAASQESIDDLLGHITCPTISHQPKTHQDPACEKCAARTRRSIGKLLEGVCVCWFGTPKLFKAFTDSDTFFIQNYHAWQV